MTDPDARDADPDAFDADREAYRDAPYAEKRVRYADAPAEVLWDVVAGLGGDQGYPAFDTLWQWRAALDRIVGGPGMRGRPARAPRPGDVIDFWRVEQVDAPHALRLRAEMRMPGTAWLGLEVEPLEEHRSLLVQRTWFSPGWGPWGHAFWWTELPAHAVVFGRMCDGIVRDAERPVGER